MQIVRPHVPVTTAYRWPLLEKFTGCLEAGGVGADDGRRAADLILDLESQPDVRPVTGLLSAQASQRPLAGSVNPAE